MKQKLISVFLLLMGIVMLVAGFTRSAEIAEIQGDGVGNSAQVISKTAIPGKKGHVSYNLFLKVVGFGNSQQEVTVTKAIYDSTSVGSKVPIILNVNKPSEFLVVGNNDDSQRVKLIGGLLIILGGVGVWWFFFKTT